MAYQPGDPENYFAQAGGMSPQGDDPAMRALMSDVAPIPEWMQASQQMSPPGAPPQIPGLVADPETVIKELTNDRIVNQTQQDIAESRNARQEREEAWRESADLYNNVLDDTGKADWQSKVFIPQIFLKVEMACSLVKASFFQDPKWFTLEQVPAWDPGTADVQFVEHVCEVALEQAKFVDAYGKVVEEGFLYGAGCLKLVWEQYISRGPELIEPPPQLADQAMMLGIPPPPPMVSAIARPRSRLRCYQVPIWNIYPDPFFEDFYEGRYTVEELLVDQEELEQGIQAGRYNCIESLDDIGEPCGLTYEYERRNREARLTYSQRRGPRKQHLLQIRYGNFYDSKGRLLVENWVSIVANKQKVIALDSNPSFTGKRPYIWCTPLPMRGSPWGREIIFAAKPLQNALNAIYNLTIDSTSYAVIPAVTINKNRLDPDEELDSITPGGGYYVTADNAIQPLKISSVPNEAMPMIQSFEQKIDEATMMYGTLGGEPPLKGRSTATQYKGELQQGQAQASLLARGLEMRDIEPAVQLVYENLLQYLSDVSDPKMQEAFSLFGGPQAFLDPATRFRLLNGRFKVKARGISGMIDRKNRADKLMQLATTAQMLGLPFQVQAKIFYRTAASMDIDPRELDAPPDEAAWQAYVQQMMAQQMGAGSQGGGANAREASPEPPSAPPGNPGPPAESTMENQMAAMTGPPAAGPM